MRISDWSSDVCSSDLLLFFEMFQILVRYASQQIQRLLQPRRRHGRKDQKSVHHEWQGRPLIESRLKCTTKSSHLQLKIVQKIQSGAGIQRQLFQEPHEGPVIQASLKS